jgi:hypothetical protein
MKTYTFIYLVAALLFSACSQPVPAGKIINYQASVPASFGLGKMEVITSLINKRQHTMSTLYGNAVSVKRARSGAMIQPGEKLLLVTWQQKPDENWFGANIPNRIERVEQIETTSTPETAKYLCYTGSGLALSIDTTGQNSRINAIFGLQASVMP